MYRRGSKLFFVTPLTEFLFLIKKFMIQKGGNNFAFIDSQNVYQGTKELGWRLDWHRFRIYLREKYEVSRAYLFLGYIPKNEKMYKLLENADFVLCFKKVTNVHGEIKGNVDVNLTLKAILEKDNYDQAILVTSDGDFYPLVEYLTSINKLYTILSPCETTCSKLLKESAKKRIYFMQRLKDKIGQK